MVLCLCFHEGCKFLLWELRKLKPKAQYRSTRKNTRAETQVCLVSTSVCRLSLCSRTDSCHCVPWSNMFAIKLKRLEWQSLWAHYPLRTMQCDSEMADKNLMLSFQLKGSVMITAIHFLKAAEWKGLTREWGNCTVSNHQRLYCSVEPTYLLSSQTSSGLSPQGLWWPVCCCDQLRSEINSKEK